MKSGIEVYWVFRTDVFAVKPSFSSEESLHRNSAHLKTENAPKFIWKAFVIVKIVAVTNSCQRAAAPLNEEGG